MVTTGDPEPSFPKVSVLPDSIMGRTRLWGTESFGGSMVGTVPEQAASVQLRSGPSSRRQRCRCGTRLAAGAPCFEFAPVPEPLVELLRAQAFCSPACSRAFVLEAMEVLEGQASPELLSDVQSVYTYLQRLFRLAQEAAMAAAVPAAQPA